MKRQVTVVRHADRHAQDHARDFAEARTVEVIEGEDKAALVAEALDRCMLDLGGRFTVLVEEPHE